MSYLDSLRVFVRVVEKGSITAGGREPVTLRSGETRRFLEDGDEVILHARARRDGCAPIGFGECRGRVVGAADRFPTVPNLP